MTEPASIVQVVTIASSISGLLGGAFAAGGAWVAVRKSLNGLGDRIRSTADNAAETKRDVKEVMMSVADHGERLSYVEARQESHDGWIRRVEDELKEDRRRGPR